MISRQRQYQARHKARGLCVTCPKRAMPGYIHCKQHAHHGQWRQVFKSLAAKAELVRLWQSGMTIARIAQTFRVSHAAVTNQLKPRCNSSGVGHSLSRSVRQWPLVAPNPILHDRTVDGRRARRVARVATTQAPDVDAHLVGTWRCRHRPLRSRPRGERHERQGSGTEPDAATSLAHLL